MSTAVLRHPDRPERRTCIGNSTVFALAACAHPVPPGSPHAGVPHPRRALSSARRSRQRASATGRPGGGLETGLPARRDGQRVRLLCGSRPRVLAHTLGEASLAGWSRGRQCRARWPLACPSHGSARLATGGVMWRDQSLFTIQRRMHADPLCTLRQALQRGGDARQHLGGHVLRGGGHKIIVIDAVRGNWT